MYLRYDYSYVYVYNLAFAIGIIVLTSLVQLPLLFVHVINCICKHMINISSFVFHSVFLCQLHAHKVWPRLFFVVFQEIHS